MYCYDIYMIAGYKKKSTSKETKFKVGIAFNVGSRVTGEYPNQFVKGLIHSFDISLDQIYFCTIKLTSKEIKDLKLIAEQKYKKEETKLSLNKYQQKYLNNVVKGKAEEIEQKVLTTLKPFSSPISLKQKESNNGHTEWVKITTNHKLNISTWKQAIQMIESLSNTQMKKFNNIEFKNWKQSNDKKVASAKKKKQYKYLFSQSKKRNLKPLYFSKNRIHTQNQNEEIKPTIQIKKYDDEIKEKVIIDNKTIINKSKNKTFFSKIIKNILKLF